MLITDFFDLQKAHDAPQTLQGVWSSIVLDGISRLSAQIESTAISDRRLMVAEFFEVLTRFTQELGIDDMAFPEEQDSLAERLKILEKQTRKVLEHEIVSSIRRSLESPPESKYANPDDTPISTRSKVDLINFLTDLEKKVDTSDLQRESKVELIRGLEEFKAEVGKGKMSIRGVYWWIGRISAISVEIPSFIFEFPAASETLIRMSAILSEEQTAAEQLEQISRSEPLLLQHSQGKDG